MTNNPVKKAMIMAAGVGSRLEPLTLSVPKPLIPIANKPVMDILLENLKNIGITDVIANTYYLAEQIIQRYKNNNSGINFNYIKEDTLSGTAGGLKKCQDFFQKGDVFVVLSADGLTNADIQKGIESHLKNHAVATIGIKKIPHEEVSHFGVVVTDENGFIKEFQEKPSVAEAKSNYINTGIYIFNYEIFDYIPSGTFYDFAKNVFPKLLQTCGINTFEITEYWSDIGTITQYKQSVKDVFDGFCNFEHSAIQAKNGGKYIVGSTDIPEDTRFEGLSTIGNGCHIGQNVTIKDSIIWDNVEIADNVRVENAIVASGSRILSDLEGMSIPANDVFLEELFLELEESAK